MFRPNYFHRNMFTHCNFTSVFVIPKLNPSGCKAIDCLDPKDDKRRIPNIKISAFFNYLIDFYITAEIVKVLYYKVHISKITKIVKSIMKILKMRRHNRRYKGIKKSANN